MTNTLSFYFRFDTNWVFYIQNAFLLPKNLSICFSSPLKLGTLDSFPSRIAQSSSVSLSFSAEIGHFGLFSCLHCPFFFVLICLFYQSWVFLSYFPQYIPYRELFPYNFSSKNKDRRRMKTLLRFQSVLRPFITFLFVASDICL